MEESDCKWIVVRVEEIGKILYDVMLHYIIKG